MPPPPYGAHVSTTSTCHCETPTLRCSLRDELEQLPVHRAGPALPAAAAAASARPAPRPAPLAAEASASPGRTGAPCRTRRAALPEELEPPATVSAASAATATVELRGAPSPSRVFSEPPAALPAPLALPEPPRLPLGLRPQLPPAPAFTLERPGQPQQGRRRRIEELSRSSREKLLQSRDRMFSKLTSILQHAVEAVRPRGVRGGGDRPPGLRGAGEAAGGLRAPPDRSLCLPAPNRAAPGASGPLTSGASGPSPPKTIERRRRWAGLALAFVRVGPRARVTPVPAIACSGPAAHLGRTWVTDLQEFAGPRSPGSHHLFPLSCLILRFPDALGSACNRCSLRPVLNAPRDLTQTS